MKIEKKQIKYNITKRNSPINYIVIHDTQNVSKGANADAHFKYFNGGNRNSSADFFVDDMKILQVNDYTKYCTWQVGDGKGRYGITNKNSVGVEICVNSDGNYQKAFLNAVELTKYLMKELDIPVERVVRHYDASRKNCPASMGGNGWTKWIEFKKALQEGRKMVFTDIKGHYAEREIEELVKMQILNGVGDGRFCPDEPVKRGDIAIAIRKTIRHITGE